MRERAPFAADENIAQQLRQRYPHLRCGVACQVKTVIPSSKTVNASCDCLDMHVHGVSSLRALHSISPSRWVSLCVVTSNVFAPGFRGSRLNWVFHDLDVVSEHI